MEFAEELEQYMSGKDMNQGLVWVNKAIQRKPRSKASRNSFRLKGFINKAA